MPLSNLLRSASGTWPFCHQKAGILSWKHPQCRRTFQADWREIVNLAAQAAASHQFDEKILQLTLAEIAHRSFRDGATVNQDLEDTWKRGMGHAPWPTGS